MQSPVVCGRVESRDCGIRVRQFFRSVAQSLERAAWDREAVGDCFSRSERHLLDL
jgi:hypothetical protein